MEREPHFSAERPGSAPLFYSWIAASSVWPRRRSGTFSNFRSVRKARSLASASQVAPTDSRITAEIDRLLPGR